jgi:hypothetical protein
MTTQREWLLKAVDLSRENPDAEIHCFISSDEVSEFAYSSQQIFKVALEWWYCPNEEIIVGLEYIIEQLEYESDDESDDENAKEISEEDAKKVSKQVISIYTRA